ncbi:MAG TPA: sigma 54-interacting transcriptional regulator [Polyangiales bacterium]|jgi:DNA-binding NtrC family response regulator|nr:sigma 54-interacting transcriptional regulator [Polyangiales bacterium]
MSDELQNSERRGPGTQVTTDPASLADLTATEKRAAYLVVVHTPDAKHLGKRLVLGDDLLLLGREIDASGVCVDDPRMSRVHARFTLDGRAGLFRIGDSHSRNGTFVNGERVETQLLSDGDVIRSGDTLLVYSEGSALERARRRAEALARSELNILVLGETGTGKELFSRMIHEKSERKGEFVAINCASVPSELVGAEFFGHTKSAFSGAQAPRKGMFVAADKGTLLLDEVGDCPPDVQASLLRAIQEKAVRPIGAEKEVPVDVRVIAATHANLSDAVEQGKFRADLFARLSQATVELPPLRARKAELLELAHELAREARSTLQLSADAAEALLLWSWPLNVRELQSLVRAFCTLHPGSELDLTALAEAAPSVAAPIVARKRRSDALRTTHSSLPPSAIGEPAADRSKLKQLLETNGGNVSAVADALGKPRAQVYRWMKSMGLAPGKFRR